MVSLIAIDLIDGNVNLIEVVKSWFFQFLEISEISLFKIISLIKLIVDDGSVKIIDATINI